ncbi:beta-ketoacyl synthase N-terminal-like domain-containing protein [Actinophytocola oryzae]|uniref:3-oxoacyl-[acyl-carrier-protein] synthase II n=1 Tax=Actinophytocola oryzae TaxID=502181 RepID=A0A4R7VXE7_9PSEU|nr:beta-ketoacyl synthase N-terminal-like domain-containing protein [Actinophytocola oryzae]TDV54806.1 3-oxoacyl-[acyl-carrier-protein] synthase II [Actinophytocola oryzae]
MSLVFTGAGAVRPTGPTPVPDLPWPTAHVVEGLDFAAVLGRKTVRFNNRTTNLALVACGEALADAGLEVTDDIRDTVGVSFGTTCGSVTGAVEFGWDSFDRTRPHMVNPATMPNTVLNTTAGAMAIKYGLKGANSTVVAGPLAGLGALRNAAVMLHAVHADTMLVGAAEEVTGPGAWFAHATRPDSLPGEGAAVFVLERADVAIEAGRRPLARLGAVRSHTGDVRRPDTVCDAVAETLDAAGIEPERVRWVAMRVTGDSVVDAAQRVGLGAVLPIEPEDGIEELGDCYAGHAALQLAELVTRARTEGWSRDDAGVVVAADPDGALAVAVVTGWSDDDNPLSRHEENR